MSRLRFLLGVNPGVAIVYQHTRFRKREVRRNESAGPAELTVSLGNKPHDRAVVNS